jgi:hypothetical protein
MISRRPALTQNKPKHIRMESVNKNSLHQANPDEKNSTSMLQTTQDQNYLVRSEDKKPTQRA